MIQQRVRRFKETCDSANHRVRVLMHNRSPPHTHTHSPPPMYLMVSREMSKRKSTDTDPLRDTYWMSLFITHSHTRSSKSKLMLRWRVAVYLCNFISMASWEGRHTNTNNPFTQSYFRFLHVVDEQTQYPPEPMINSCLLRIIHIL